MLKLKYLVKAVCGLRTAKTLDGRPVPQSVNGWKSVAIVHDRRLSAGIFSKRRKRKSPDVYRIVVWRTYRDKKAGKERATTTLHADEIEPVLDLVAKLGDRFGIVSGK